MGSSLCSLCRLGPAKCWPRTRVGRASQFLGSAESNSQQLIGQGQEVFRFDTFGDQAFWGGQLRLHEVVNNLPPLTALALGLKVDSDALSPSTVEALKQGKVNLDDPAVTRQLTKQNTVLGVVGRVASRKAAGSEARGVAS